MINQIIATLSKISGKYSMYEVFTDWIRMMALRQGMPLLTVSKMLGHESIGTTQIYLDISDKELEQAHERYVV